MHSHTHAHTHTHTHTHTRTHTHTQMLKHGRAGVPMEVMGLMLGEFVDDYTVRVIDVFAMPQSGTVSRRTTHSACTLTTWLLLQVCALVGLCTCE